MPNYRNEIALAAGLYLEHAEAGFGIMEGDALDRPGKRLNGSATFELPRSRPLVHLRAYALRCPSYGSCAFAHIYGTNSGAYTP
ncbi:hypothetical protein DHODJN_22080 [Methylorubrum extorquens]